jgi:hypothetical protein
MTTRCHCLLPAARTRAGLALLLLGLLAGVQAMVISQRLHEHVHADAHAADHHCAVTLFSSGQVDAAVPLVSVPAPASVPFTLFSLLHLVLEAGEHRLPPGRAPPALA